MSILSWVTSIFGLVKIPGIGVPREEGNPTTLDDRGSGEYSKWNDDRKGREDYSKHDGGWKDAKNDDCQPQKDYCDPKPSDDGSKSDTYRNPGEALARFDFSHGDFGAHGPDHSGDMQAALASMSSDDALEYAIGQMGSTDHIDVGHFHVPADTSHDTDA
ncbi:hypothetical protein [Bradyrhizobium valentinum]|uniref:hypothetical protein n=1 Tax=Bradyrhizobium valentinum TaxID=1518501 RepID=UPI00070D21B2|nr:hypothetical protein [Bradyrhizobium valentinum]KRQ97767.1 hypothetical protein CQ10_28485 [Bradyrhizobium valentinum]